MADRSTEIENAVPTRRRGIGPERPRRIFSKNRSQPMTPAQSSRCCVVRSNGTSESKFNGCLREAQRVEDGASALRPQLGACPRACTPRVDTVLTAGARLMVCRSKYSILNGGRETLLPKSVSRLGRTLRRQWLCARARRTNAVRPRRSAKPIPSFAEASTARPIR